MIVEFVVEVGLVEILKMLFVFSCVDLVVVGLGVFNDWK